MLDRQVAKNQYIARDFDLPTQDNLEGTEF